MRKLAVALLILSACWSANADTIVADSLNLVDVQAAVDAATAGDTVQLPSGSVTWSSGSLTISKSITLEGAGKTSTVIENTQTTVNGNTNITIYLNPQAAGRVRVTGIGFDCNRTSGSIYIDSGSSSFREFQIDNCRFFDVAARAIYVEGLMAGLVYDCDFVDCFKTVDVYAGDAANTSWTTALSLGTVNTVTIEDCTITYDSYIGGSTGATTSSGQGGRRLLRYNTWTNNYNAGFFPIVDAHGNQETVSGQNIASDPPGGTGTHRGTRQLEMYENTFTSTIGPGKSFRLTDIRGGTAIIYSNTFTGIGMDTKFRMREEDGPSEYNFRTEYPGYDPHLVFAWSNTSNGSAITQADFAYAEDSTFIVEDTNLFWREPDTGDPIIESYTPLDYPHPWRAVGGGAPNTPTLTSATAQSPYGIVLVFAKAGSGATATSLRIERSLSTGTGFVQIASLDPDDTGYVDDGLDEATAYYYQLRAVNEDGASDYAAEVNATTNAVSARSAPSAEQLRRAGL